jgi:hypothetical protein
LPYEIVGDSSDEGDSSHWIVLFCERYWFTGVGGQRGAAVDKERLVGKTLLASLVLAQSQRFPASKSVGCGVRKWCCAICISRGLI